MGGRKSGCKVALKVRHVVPLEPALTTTLTQDCNDSGLRFQYELPSTRGLLRYAPRFYGQKNSKNIFTREYTQCTAGYTFCFVVGVVVVGATFNHTWQYFS
jgi:hypothetical protein